MPDAVLTILMTIINFGGEATLYEIESESGYCLAYPRLVAHKLVANGWLGHFRKGGVRDKWWITERGKIAVAIEIGRRSRARSMGVQHVCPTFREYMNYRKMVAA